MFHVKVIVKESGVHGLGLFADEPIAQEQLVYTSNPDLDLVLSKAAFEMLAPEEQAHIAHYGFKDTMGFWHLAHDDIRFCNHSKNGNVTLTEEGIVATRDIDKGEELLQDYGEFEDLDESRRNIK